MYTFLGITLVLALLLTINATATLMAAGFGRLCKPLLRKCSARTRAEILFVMRIGPPVLAILAIAAFMIPSYLVYEPHQTDESVSWKLGLLAALSAIGVGLAIARGIRTWLATRSLADAGRPTVSQANVQCFPAHLCRSTMVRWALSGGAAGPQWWVAPTGAAMSGGYARTRWCW